MSDEIHVEIAQCPDIDDAKDRVIKAIRQEMHGHASRMKNFAQHAVPFKTSKLKNSITFEVTSDSDSISITLGADARSENKDGAGEPYGPFVEFGTGQRGMATGASYNGIASPGIEYNAAWKGMEAQPFFRPALYDLKDELISELDHVIKEALK